jgi:mono/diheme cytochrome c family protein
MGSPRKAVEVGRWRRLALAAVVCLPSCAGTPIPAATPADVQRAATSRPATTLSELERGRALYVGRCSACHQPVAPGSIPATEWPEHVSEMKVRARLEPEEEQLVVLYLVTMAERPAAATP